MPPKTPALPLASPSAPCPCGSGKHLGICCLPYIQGAKAAPTAASLMRSRYTAHVLLAIDYLWETWDNSKRQRSSPEEIHAWASQCEWLGLEIIATDKGESKDMQGLVSFIARFRQDHAVHEHREISLFQRQAGRWVYIDHA